MSSRSRSRRWLAVAAVVGTLALTAVGCGSSGKTTKTGSGSDAKTTTTAGSGQTTTTKKAGGYGY
jgi:hypothetical protein